MKIVMPESNTLTKGDIDLEAHFDIEGAELVLMEHPTIDEMVEAIADADVVMANKYPLDESTLKGARQLKYIGECATGYNNIDLEYCKEHGITVTNVPDYSTNAVAQQVFAYILYHFSKVDRYNDFVADGGWVNSQTFAPYVFDTDELFGKTIGLVGYGKIGKAVAKIANAFGMNVMVYTRSYGKALELSKNSRDGDARTVLDGFINRTESYVSYVSLENLLRHSDVVSVHCPLNPESEKMFNAELFSKMRKGAFFVNTSRGPVVDEQALADALKSGRLKGAALDVLCSEPMDKDCPLLGLENCLITPHVAWEPLATRKRLVSVAADNLKKYLAGKPVNVVN